MSQASKYLGGLGGVSESSHCSKSVENNFCFFAGYLGMSSFVAVIPPQNPPAATSSSKPQITRFCYNALLPFCFGLFGVFLRGQYLIVQL